MNRENPVYDKPFVTKEPGNKLRISKSAYKAWLPMFYCIPKEIVQQRPIYLQLPRCPYEILRTDKYDKIVNDDAFLARCAGCQNAGTGTFHFQIQRIRPDES